MSMGRRRKHNKHLPRGVTLEHGSFYFRGSDRKRLNLGRDFAQAMTAYREILGKPTVVTFGDVLDRYLRTEVPKKAPATRKDNIQHMQAVRRVFGKMKPRHIQPVHIYQFRDKVAEKSGPTQANLHLALLKHVFVKAIEWGACGHHPATNVRKIPVAPRDRYVEDWEFDVVRRVAPQ